MAKIFPALVCLLFLLIGCSNPEEAAPVGAPRIDYVFLDLDNRGDSSPSLNSVWDMVTDSTDIHLAMSEWASPILNKELVTALDKNQGARLGLFTDPKSWDKDTGDSIRLVRNLLRERSWMKGQIVVINDMNPRVGRLGENIDDESVSLKENFILFSSLQRPEYGDATPALLFLNSSAHAKGFSAHSFGVLIRGDHGLYDAYLDFWVQLSESRIDFEHRKIRTYSDQHDHRAWFFPDQNGLDSSTGLISSLMEVVSETGKPARLLIFMPEWNESHLELAQVLKELSVEYEADIRIITLDTPSSSPIIRQRLNMFPEGMVRWVPELDLNPFVVLDGPLLVAKDALPERKQIAWIGSHSWTQYGLDHDSNSSLAIFDKALVNSLGEVWWTIWKSNPPPPVIDSLVFD